MLQGISTTDSKTTGVDFDREAFMEKYSVGKIITASVCMYIVRKNIANYWFYRWSRCDPLLEWN